MVPLLLFCVRNTYSICKYLCIKAWSIEAANSWICLVNVCNVFFFMQFKLLYKSALLCPSTKSDIYVVDSCYSDLDVFCFYLRKRDRIISVNSELHRNV